MTTHTDWLDDVRGWVIDVDGCLVRTDRAGGAGGTAMARAGDLIRLLLHRGDPVIVCTNASQRPPAEYAEHLREIGIPIPDERFVTAGSASAEHIATTHPGARVLVVGESGVAEPLRALGVTLASASDAEPADVVVVGAADVLTGELLNAACLAVDAGAPLYTSVYIPWFHGGRGKSVAVSAAFCASIAWVTGVEPQVCGKPSAHLGASLLRQLGVPADRVAVVGDATAEIGLARAMGARSIVVTSGAIRPDAVDSLPADLTPDLVLRDVEQLHSLIASTATTHRIEDPS